MDKHDYSINFYSHGVCLFEKKSLVITGEKNIENFDKEQFLLETIMGFMLIKGKELELVMLDTLQGNVTIKGTINCIDYIEENLKKSKEESIFSRLFK